jgi:hypothetical protein
MPVTLPAPYGKANWTNYEDYWRDQDAEWIQDRLVLRVLLTSDITALGLTKGGVVYDEQDDALKWRSKTDIGGNPNWKKIVPIPDSITTAETASTTALTYKTSNQGIVLSATDVAVTASKFTVLTDKAVIDATGLALKTGSWTAKLSTSTTSLVSDSPVSVPSLAATGALTAATATLTGALTVAAVTASGTISGNVVNGASGTIGGVALTANKATASSGFDSTNSSFYGDANGAYVRNLARTGPFFQAQNSKIITGGTGDFEVSNQIKLMTNMGIIHNTTGRYIAPSFYAASDPGVANFPEGTIWIS